MSCPTSATTPPWLGSTPRYFSALCSIGWPPSRPSFPPQTGTRPSATSRPMSCDPWKLTSILWPLLIAAVLPLTLADAIRRLPNLVRRLRHTEAIEPPHQGGRFRRKPLIPWGEPHPSC